MNSKVILYIAMSEDGFIAGENDNIDFLNEFQVEGEDYGYGSFIQTISSIIVGRKTYEKVINMGYPYHEDKDVYVITRNSRQSSDRLHFYSRDLKNLIGELRKTNSGNIYCDGGAELAQTLISLGLIDRIILSIIPVNLTKGTLLFKNGLVPSEFEVEHMVEFKTGLIQYTYNLT